MSLLIALVTHWFPIYVATTCDQCSIFTMNEFTCAAFCGETIGLDAANTILTLEKELTEINEVYNAYVTYTQVPPSCGEPSSDTRSECEDLAATFSDLFDDCQEELVDRMDELYLEKRKCQTLTATTVNVMLVTAILMGLTVIMH